MNTNLKLNRIKIKLNQIYLHIFNHLNKNYYQETVLLDIKKILNILVSFFTSEMRLEDFQLLDIQPFDNSNIKRDFTKIYHNQGVQLNQPDQNIVFVFGETNNYHQIGNRYLELDITVRKSDTTIFYNDDPVRLVNNGFAFCSKMLV